jgi:N-acyl amino acid synthase of PEP-CTERM/exosortase system
VRLILADQRAPGESFRVQQIYSHPLLNELQRPGDPEVSRFAISKRIRKTIDENTSFSIDANDDCPIDRKMSLILGLMKATVQMSLAHGVTEWLAAMEPCLLRLLRRFGIYFKLLGPVVGFHGFPPPCYANFQKVLEAVHQQHYGLWEFVTE